ncbi:MAG: prepilin-type N-terminal cleavage/methylation domain-containing protein [Pirellulaceae bacterium]
MAQERHFRRGMTLVELLMVVAIMTVLMAVAIPMVRPAFRDRQLREAARQMNVFFSGAKARAAESGRPFGVWMEVQADPDSGPYAVQLHMAEVAPDFTGAVLGERCTVEQTGPTTGQLHFWLPDGTQQDTEYLERLLNPDRVEKFHIGFDHKGPVYKCEHDPSNAGVFEIFIPRGVPPGTRHPSDPSNPGPRPVGQTFEITRAPNKSIVTPLTLPGDAVIDLTVSGVGLGANTNSFAAASANMPLMVMFNPTGQVKTVRMDNVSWQPTGSIYLMIGRRAKVVTPGGAGFSDPEVSNVADPANLWLTINSRTGAVTTEDNAATSPASMSVQARIKAAREFARGSRQKGGR